MADEKPERSVFFVERMVTFHTGVAMTSPVGVFDNREAAESSNAARSNELQSLLSGAYLCMAHQLPDGRVELVNTGIRLGSFMNQLGVKNIGHRIMEMPLAGADIVVPQKRIIIPH